MEHSEGEGSCSWRRRQRSAKSNWWCRSAALTTARVTEWHESAWSCKILLRSALTFEFASAHLWTENDPETHQRCKDRRRRQNCSELFYITCWFLLSFVGSDHLPFVDSLCLNVDHRGSLKLLLMRFEIFFHTQLQRNISLCRCISARWYWNRLKCFCLL